MSILSDNFEGELDKTVREFFFEAYVPDNPKDLKVSESYRFSRVKNMTADYEFIRSAAECIGPWKVKNNVVYGLHNNRTVKCDFVKPKIAIINDLNRLMPVTGTIMECSDLGMAAIETGAISFCPKHQRIVNILGSQAQFRLADAGSRVMRVAFEVESVYDIMGINWFNTPAFTETRVFSIHFCWRPIS
jgi:hypothetical protein